MKKRFLAALLALTMTLALLPSTALAAGNYTLKVFNEQYNGEKNINYSSALKNVTLTVSTPPGLVITEPQDTTVTEGNINSALTVAAPGTGTLTYQWCQCDDTSKTNADDMAGVTSATYSLPANMTAGTYYYFCKVSLNNNPLIDSRVATVTVNPALHITITSNAAFPVGSSGGDRTVVIGHGTGLGKDDVGALSVDGDQLDLDTDYTKATASSVNITLKERWLNTLPAGTHRLNVPVTSGIYDGETRSVDIVVTAPADVPKTGDGSTPYLWAGLALLAGVGLAASAVLSRRKRRSN